MQKVNPAGVIAATFAFFVIGFFWYGVFFSDAWMTAQGVTDAAAEGQSPLWMGLGLVITLAQALGLALILKWKGDYTPGAAAMTAALLWALIALPFTLYAYAYLPAHNLMLLAIDASHLLVGWVTAAVVLMFFK